MPSDDKRNHNIPQKPQDTKDRMTTPVPESIRMKGDNDKSTAMLNLETPGTLPAHRQPGPSQHLISMRLGMLVDRSPVKRWKRRLEGHLLC